ncbi:MAG: diguanylate cyclase [Aquabacterium sp.]|uniref:GGDEF domain-containing protein n=1 Tax=Aquabacterium sp. TaxID=1872578 RepID=UPI0025BF976E|nr:diguanylate cyclase [Aquabacterium sp.]MBI3382440.1 diguanylate cyclase [Aquabacterium sp.]
MLFSHLLPDQVQDVLDALPTPVFFKDRHGVYKGCNRAFARLIGRRRREIVGLTVFDISPEEYAKSHFDADAALMRAGGEQRYEAQIKRCDGERRHVVFHKAALYDAQGELSGIVGTILDITERKALEVQLADMAERDALTGLFNRRAILAHLEALHRDRRQASQSLCLMMCDVDHFKRINDRHGHAKGDEVLRQVAHLLSGKLRDGDRVGRIGGEEFLIVLASADLEDARQVAERLRQQVADLSITCAEGARLDVTISIGVARSLHQDEDWADVIARADAGLYAAKRAGRDKVIVADAHMLPANHKDWHQA